MENLSELWKNMKSFVVTLEFGQPLQNSSGQNHKQPGSRLIGVPYEGETMQACILLSSPPSGTQALRGRTDETGFLQRNLLAVPQLFLSTKFAFALWLFLRTPFVCCSFTSQMLWVLQRGPVNVAGRKEREITESVNWENSNYVSWL